MKELIEKISTYNIFNYLFPGIVFVVILREMSHYDLLQENTVLGLFLYYFIGLVISRIGSLIIEPALKKSSFVKFEKYEEYVFASDKDNKIELFSEVNNMYRTIISLLFVTLLAKLYEFISSKIGISQELSIILLTVLLLIIFVFSYRKQTNYVVKRVNSRTKKPKV